MIQPNGLGWLSSSSAEIARARSVLDALRKPGVIDELGFLMLNGAFAERLYPGVTTIMTRARYLVFVPAIYAHLEQSRKAIGRDSDRLSRDLQFDLRNALEKNESSFIGKEGGRNLIRVPSTIYWTALGALGITVRRISEAAYQRQLTEGVFGQRSYKDDDDAAHDEEAESLWNPALKVKHVLSDGKFPDTTSFRLRSAEAAFLESRYAALVPDGHENLVTRMVTLGRRHGASSLADIEYPWNIPDCEPAVNVILQDARHLSLLARGATLQYYRMLIDRRKDADPGVDEAFARWWEAAMPELASWDLAAFFRRMTIWDAGRGANDRLFISSWIERMQSADKAAAALNDATARQIVARREDLIRPGKQRLKVKHQLESWRLPNGFSTGFFYMDYRHRVGRQIAMDIVDGLERGAA